MQTEVLALFQKELKEEIRLIETLLPDFGDARVQHELSRIFHSMKGAASLLKIDSIRKASAFFEKRMNDDVIFDAERLKKGIMHFVDHLKEIAECKEGQFIQTIKEKESDFDQLEKMFAVSCDISLPNGEATTATLKEIMIRFKQHLNYCETHFDDLARLALLEEISTELKEFGRQNHIPIVQEAGKALSLCFFAARKKLLGWTRGHFDLITEIVEFLSSVSTQTQEERTQWIEYSKKNVETCIGIISALASEAIQFVQNDLGEDSMTVVPIELKAEPILHREEQDLRFLGLFLSELKDQIKDFESDLILIEKQAADQKIASKLMRASHSLKGAAKAVEFHALTRLAHAMEDIFSLVQKGEGEITPEAADLLFKAVDLLTSLSKIEALALPSWLNTHKKIIDEVVEDLGTASLTCVHKQKGERTLEQSEQPIKTQSYTKPVSDSGGVSKKRRFLRVSLSQINHLMKIAGEFLVESKSLETFERDFEKVKVKAVNFGLELDRYIEKSQLGDSERVLRDYKECVSDISHLIGEFNRYVRTSETLSTKFYDEMVESRMRPFAEGAEFLPRLMRDLCKQLGKKANLEFFGKDTLVDREILEKLETPLAHLIRNAIDHGIEPPLERLREGKPEAGTIKIEASHQSGSLVISISDDGKGIDREQVKQTLLTKHLVHESIIEKINDEEFFRYLFHPGVSTSKEVTDISGRGIGLSIVLGTIEQLGGKMEITKTKNGAQFTMILPLTLSIIRALIVKIAHEHYAFPLAKIKKVLYIDREEVSWLEGREYFKDGDINIGLIHADKIFGLSSDENQCQRLPIVVISDRDDYGIIVEEFSGEREIAIHELDKNLGQLELISAGSFMENGSPLLILDTLGVKKCIDRIISEQGHERLSEPDNKKITQKKVLIVDDSSIVRQVLKFLLTKNGYHCFEATNGEDALRLLKLEKVNLIVTDIDMPKRNGLELIHEIREVREDLTPIIVLSYQDETRFKKFMESYREMRFFSKNRFKDSLFLAVAKEFVP